MLTVHSQERPLDELDWESVAFYLQAAQEDLSVGNYAGAALSLDYCADYIGMALGRSISGWR